MAVVISVINNKGGTGKTTTSLNLAAALARKKKKVLIIDLDSQCNLTSAMGLTPGSHHIGSVLLNETSINESIIKGESLYILPSTPNLLDYEYRINSEPGREYLLKEVLEPIQDSFHYIVIDCPPSLGTLSMNSLVAANMFIVPMQAENFAFIGLDKILYSAGKVRIRMNPGLELGGILMVRQSTKTKFSQAVISNIESNENLKGKLFKTFIRQDINLMESGAFHKDIFQYAPKSRGAQDFSDLAKEVAKIPVKITQKELVS